jgi:hypothetical protein
MASFNALGCWLDGQGSILDRDKDFFFLLHHRVRTGSGARPVSFLESDYVGK